MQAARWILLREEQVVLEYVDVGGWARVCTRFLCLAGCLCRGDVQHRTDHVVFDSFNRVRTTYSIPIPVTILEHVQNIPRLQKLS